ncbi:hypothetical protein J2T50_000524 [Streptococcus gallinaceus]|uniref:hypothetical protein n=1 Tax=Streptococcus gallinaceus TaxID=165758 RepID=UPI00209ED43B|nr:hypothetical protein [Streptococcus gallinaceus]MCP1638829.1 hypothetical protein [Streptococcus gallinaceus]MCP1769927.1 hypothetical protein [Streptococcus gallinaceus]
MHPLFWGILAFAIGVFIYLLLHLKKLEDWIKGYHLKNQEGVGALSKSRNPFYLFCIFVSASANVISWLYNGLDRYTLLGLLPTLLFCYLYFCQDEDK